MILKEINDGMLHFRFFVQIMQLSHMFYFLLSLMHHTFVQHVTCGSIPLETSYQNVSRCIYASTELYEYHKHFTWGLRHSEVSLSNSTYMDICHLTDFPYTLIFMSKISIYELS